MKAAHTNSEILKCKQLSGAYRVAEGDVGGKGEEQDFGDEAEHEGRGHGMAVTSAGECSLSHTKALTMLRAGEEHCTTLLMPISRWTGVEAYSLSMAIVGTSSSIETMKPSKM